MIEGILPHDILFGDFTTTFAGYSSDHDAGGDDAEQVHLDYM